MKWLVIMLWLGYPPQIVLNTEGNIQAYMDETSCEVGVVKAEWYYNRDWHNWNKPETQFKCITHSDWLDYSLGEEVFDPSNSLWTD